MGRMSKMKKQHQKGYTLPELLVTIFIAGIAVSLIMTTYSIVFRVWSKYNLKLEASNEAWLCYNKIQNIFSKTTAIKKVSDTSWYVYKSSSRFEEIVYKPGVIAVKDSVEKWKADIDSFSLQNTDNTGVLWKCFIRCKKGKEKMSIAWFVSCTGEWSDTLVPDPRFILR